jgi:hypothetical protein
LKVKLWNKWKHAKLASGANAEVSIRGLLHRW